MSKGRTSFKEILARCGLLAAGLVIPFILIEWALAIFSPGTLWQYIYDPVTLWKPKPNSSYYNRAFSTQEPSQEPTFVQFNSLGNRDIEHDDIRGADTVIFVLGDSFAEALQVSLENTFFRLLEVSLGRALPGSRYHVINLGVGGYGTLREMYRFERHLEYYSPDIVFLLYYENDHRDNWFVKNIHVRNRQMVYEHLSFQDTWAQRFFMLSRFSHVVERLDRVYARIQLAHLSEYDSDAQRRQEGYQKTVEALDAFQYKCQTIGAKPVLVIAPSGLHLPRPEEPVDEYGIVRRFAKESKLTLIDLTQALTELQDKGIRASFVRNVHWSKEGHKVVAQVLFEFISGQQ